MVSLYGTIRWDASARANSCLIKSVGEDLPPFKVTVQTGFRIPTEIQPLQAGSLRQVRFAPIRECTDDEGKRGNSNAQRT